MTLYSWTVIILFAASLCHSHPLNIPGNKNWNCVDCQQLYPYIDSQQSLYRIYGIIRHIIHKEPRNVYFALDMSWLDNLLRFEAKVTITAISLDSIKNLVMPSPDPASLPANERDETYYIAYAELSSISSSRYSKYENVYEELDSFLALNPCWMLLHEPDIIDSTVGGASIGKDPRRNSIHRQLRASKHRSIMLVRLPIHGFHATCRLYTRITQLQYPQQCKYDAEHMLTHHLHNTGWSATFNAILFKLAHILNQQVFPKKVLAITTAIDFRSRPRLLQDRNGTHFNTTGGWYWSNPATCNPLTEAYDPYACNFISLSNCTRYGAGVSLMQPPYPPASRDYNWETPQTIRWRGFDPDSGKDSESIETLRVRFQDAPLFEEEQWCYTRFHTFLQRPNGRLRAAIRKSFKNLEFISASSDAAQKDRQRDHDGIIRKLQPCIAIHVRHGDSRHDTRGNPNRKIDRSLAAHVWNARNLSLSLGVTNLFLASDNFSVIQRASRDHPQYHWSTQRRPIKDWPGMYDVHNEADMTLELAHVIADTRIAATCDAIVGSFDSGFAEQLLVAGCQHSRLGRCPPSIDLREIYHDYG